MVPFATPLTFLTDNRQEVIRCLAISELKLHHRPTTMRWWCPYVKYIAGQTRVYVLLLPLPFEVVVGGRKGKSFSIPSDSSGASFPVSRICTIASWSPKRWMHDSHGNARVWNCTISLRASNESSPHDAISCRAALSKLLPSDGRVRRLEPHMKMNDSISFLCSVPPWRFRFS